VLKSYRFSITTLHIWLKNPAPLFHPIRSKTKTNCYSLAHVFPHFASATCYWRFDWFTVLTALSLAFVIGESDNFGCGFATLSRPFPHSASVRSTNSITARLGRTFSSICCIFVHSDLHSAPLFVGTRERFIENCSRTNCTKLLTVTCLAALRVLSGIQIFYL